jgi:hypothetical protein
VWSKSDGRAKSGGCTVDARNRNGRVKTLLVHAQGDNVARATWGCCHQQRTVTSASPSTVSHSCGQATGAAG